MAKAGQYNKASGNDPLPTLEAPEATKHQTMIEWGKEGKTDAEIAMGIFDVCKETFCRWVNEAQPSSPEFLEAYRKAKTLREGWAGQITRKGLFDSHEATKPDGTTTKAERANTGLFNLYMRNVIGWRVSDPKEDGDDKKEKSTMIYDGQLPDVLGNASD